MCNGIALLFYCLLFLKHATPIKFEAIIAYVAHGKLRSVETTFILTLCAGLFGHLLAGLARFLDGNILAVLLGDLGIMLISYPKCGFVMDEHVNLFVSCSDDCSVALPMCHNFQERRTGKLHFNCSNRVTLYKNIFFVDKDNFLLC